MELTPEQLATLAEAEERDRQRQREWTSIVRALEDKLNGGVPDHAPVPQRGQPEQVERVLTSFEAGRFLIDRMGAECAVDQDLAIVLLDLRQRLQVEYGNGPAAILLIDRAVSAYHDFVRVTGWIGNLSIHIEHEFFGLDGPSAEFRDRYGNVGRTIRGLTVEQHLSHLRERLLPLAERCGRVMREALASLETLRDRPSEEAVERSRSRSPSALALGPETT
jgi:hypothetical protein